MDNVVYPVHIWLCPGTDASALKVRLLVSSKLTSEANWLYNNIKFTKRGYVLIRPDRVNGLLNYSACKRRVLSERPCLALKETLAQVTSHRVIFEPVETTMVNADRDKIGQVLNNLISNAVKYSPQGSTINIACVTQGSKAFVSVKDEGMGISQADIPKLFERYYRVKSNGYQHVSGFGIGLYLWCEIIKRHEEDIWAESEPGKGSTFYFTLPVVS